MTKTADSQGNGRSAEVKQDETADTEAQRPRRRWRKTRIALIIVGVVVLVAAFAIRTPSPVGHWASAEGQDEFMVAYTEAFEDMPQVQESFDVRTDFGVVRFYRFAGSGQVTEPLVLLPGTASATPVWADNMPALLQIGDVYTVDLLGEPGMSVQERPITDDGDQALWLHQALQALPEEQFHLIGLSIGGWTTANLARHQPELIASATLIDPVHVFDGMPLGTIIRSIPAAFSWLPKSWRDSFNSYTAGGAEVQDVPVAQMIEAGMQHYRLKLPQPTQFSAQDITAIEVPVLAIIAGQSVMHDPDRALATAQETLGEDQVRHYPDASHAVSGEQPEQIAADIEEFLTGGS